MYRHIIKQSATGNLRSRGWMNEISQGKVAFISFEEAEVGWKKEEEPGVENNWLRVEENVYVSLIRP